MTRHWAVQRSGFFSRPCDDVALIDEADIRHLAGLNELNGRDSAKSCPEKIVRNFLQDQAVQAIGALFPNVAHGLQ
jgi:hypothetical protein